MHIPDDPLYYEKFYFTPGDLGFPNFDTRFGRIGVLVCWDQWYPEGARLSSLRGANILFYPTAIGWHPAEKNEFGAAQLDAWRTIQRSHAIANGVFVAAVNRVGYEGTPRERPRILGTFLHLRPVWSSARRSLCRQGRNADCGMRSQPHRRGSQKLAVPSRSPHRRLFPHPGAMARVRVPHRILVVSDTDETPMRRVSFRGLWLQPRQMSQSVNGLSPGSFHFFWSDRRTTSVP